MRKNLIQAVYFLGLLALGAIAVCLSKSRYLYPLVSSIGFSLSVYGWYRVLLDSRRRSMNVGIFVLGCILWIYGFAGIMKRI